MAESSAPSPSLQIPNHMVPPPLDPTPPPPPPQPQQSYSLFSFPKRPALRVTSEFDSDSLIFLHKVSCKFFDSLAKLKVSFQNNNKGQIFEPQLAFTSKHLSLHYDLEEQNAFVKSSFDVGSKLHFRAAHDVKYQYDLEEQNAFLKSSFDVGPKLHFRAAHDVKYQYDLEEKNAFVKSSFDVGPKLHFRAAHDVKAQQGEVAMIANLGDLGYALELSSPVPYVGYPKATFKSPLGEVSLVEREEEEEVKKTLSISGIAKGQILNGICTAQYQEEDLKLRYCYKDEAMAFIPTISLPSNAVAFAFKRRFSPSDKLSYWYNFDSNYWSAVYKHTYGKDFKLKAGYDSEVRLGWASLWVGAEGGKARSAPMKMKVQFMLQVPQDDIKSSALMFRVKKRWDI